MQRDFSPPNVSKHGDNPKKLDALVLNNEGKVRMLNTHLPTSRIQLC